MPNGRIWTDDRHAAAPGAPGEGDVRKRGGKVGRPSKYTPELAALICKRIAEGESLREICEGKNKAGMPSRNAVRRWLAESSDFRTLHAAARDFMVDSLAEEALHWAKTATPENANARRIYVDTIKWYVSKVAPKKYGDKLDMNVTGQVTIGDAIEEGRKRVARMRKVPPVSTHQGK